MENLLSYLLIWTCTIWILTFKKNTICLKKKQIHKSLSLESLDSKAADEWPDYDLSAHQ